MAGDLADESALFVEVHSLKVRLVAGEDLIGLRDNPDLERGKRISGKVCSMGNRGTYLGTIIFNDSLRKVLDWFAFEQHLYKQFCKPLCLHTIHHFLLGTSTAIPSDQVLHTMML